MVLARASGRSWVQASEKADSRCADYIVLTLVDLTPAVMPVDQILVVHTHAQHVPKCPKIF